MSLRSMFTKKHAINLAACALSFLISPALAVDFNTPVVNDENDFVIENNVYQNVNVEPGDSDYNGIFALTNNGSISKIENSSFLLNGSTDYYGGGLLNEGAISNITASYFQDNYTGLLNGDTISSITDSSFIYNDVAIANEGLISSITDSTFINNELGIYNDGYIQNIDNLTFIYDTLPSFGDDTDAYAGSSASNAIGIENSYRVDKINNSKFSGLSYGIANRGQINEIKNSTFDSNEVGIANNYYINTVDNSTFTNNTMAGIYNSAGAARAMVNSTSPSVTLFDAPNDESGIEKVSNSTFTNNMIGIMNEYGQIDTIENSIFNQNAAGIINADEIDIITDSSFSENEVGFYNMGDMVLVKDSDFLNNTEGGILNGVMPLVEESSAAPLSNSAFGFEPKIDLISNANFENNKGYGAIYSQFGTIDKIEDSTFTNNEGAISLDLFGKVKTVENTNFVNNYIIKQTEQMPKVTTSPSSLLERGAKGGAYYNNTFDTAQDRTYGGLQYTATKTDGTVVTIGMYTDMLTGEQLSSDAVKEKMQNGEKPITYNINITKEGLISYMEQMGASEEDIAQLEQNYDLMVDEMVSQALSQEGAITEDLKTFYNNIIPEAETTFINSNFTGNHVENEQGEALGGAIYSRKNVKIAATDGKTSLISGNYTVSKDGKKQNAIHMAPNVIIPIAEPSSVSTYGTTISDAMIMTEASSLILEATKNGVIQIDDTISGDKGGGIYAFASAPEPSSLAENSVSTYARADGGSLMEPDENGLVTIIEPQDNYKIYITGDNTGTVILNNDVEGEADMYLYQTTLKLGKRDDVLKNNNMTFNSGTFDMVNNNIGSTNFNTLTLNNNIKTKADVDLINETMDRITSDNYIINENKLNDKLISVDYLNLLNDSTKDSVKILYADEEISSNVEYIGSNPIQVDEDKIAYSPIYKYTVSYDIDENDNMGYFTFNRGNINDSNSYNPSVLAPSVSSQAGAYTTQLQTLEYAFKHSDAFMALPSFERMAIINADRYALTPTSDATDIGTFSPLMTKLDVSGFWVKPYTSFESIPLDNGPKVSNISYGTLVGYDSNLKHLKNGWERVLTGYIGYNGASQRYSGIDTYQNGGILGLTTTFYKNNFFNATTISTGAAVGDSSTYYGDEDYTMLTAGIGNKFGYNFEFKDGKFILQPNLLLSYTFINTFDYTNAAGLKIKSDPLHALQIAPGIKFIMNTESGWQPYLRADMIWNILDKTKVTANDVRLPEMSIDPYVQYGIGVQKLFKNERLTFFGQALVQNGGRNGVSLNAGLRWAVGRGK